MMTQAQMSAWFPEPLLIDEECRLCLDILDAEEVCQKAFARAQLLPQRMSAAVMNQAAMVFADVICGVPEGINKEVAILSLLRAYNDGVALISPAATNSEEMEDREKAARSIRWRIGIAGREARNAITSARAAESAA